MLETVLLAVTDTEVDAVELAVPVCVELADPLAEEDADELPELEADNDTLVEADVKPVEDAVLEIVDDTELDTVTDAVLVTVAEAELVSVADADELAVDVTLVASHGMCAPATYASMARLKSVITSPQSARCEAPPNVSRKSPVEPETHSHDGV